MDSSTKWIKEVLEKLEEERICCNTIIEIGYDHINNWLIVKRKIGPPFNLMVMSEKTVNLSNITNIHSQNGLDFLVNIPKNPYVNGEVFEYLNHNKICFGGVGDLYRFIAQNYNWPYENLEVNFILRGIKQHTNVLNIKRVDSKRYKIEKCSGSNVTILALHDYDLGGESV